MKLPSSYRRSWRGVSETRLKRQGQLLESAAVEGYRSQRLSRGEVREMLRLNWRETEEFLAKHGCVRHYTTADLDEDRETLARLPAR